MFRSDSSFTRSMLGFPRIRGDVPHTAPIRWVLPEFSPHTRGCSGIIDDFKVTPKVFPAYAGMFRSAYISAPSGPGFPRIRGDVPPPWIKIWATQSFSPHTRGCSLVLHQPRSGSGVFPAYAGMFLRKMESMFYRASFPRIRGDVPRGTRPETPRGAFSPHTRGCSPFGLGGGYLGGVFPAYAGMFPR